jgi:hypothetical protein
VNRQRVIFIDHFEFDGRPDWVSMQHGSKGDNKSIHQQDRELYENDKQQKDAHSAFQLPISKISHSSPSNFVLQNKG